LASLEAVPHSLSGCGFGDPRTDASINTTTKRVNTSWCVSAPVFQRSSSGACSAANCVVGHLHIVASTASVDSVVRRLIQAILFMGGVLCTGALFVLWRVSARISSPLRDIASVMRRFSAGDRAARAIERGPEEAMTISHVYNELIEGQEDQARNLETTVEERTLQLKDATLAAQEAERFKTTFMAHISHDMRTPLHVILSQASDVMNALEFGANPDRARAHVDVIIRECSELSFRVAQVLELTRGDTGHANLELGEVSIDVLRASILDKAQALAKQNRNTLTLVSDSGTLWTDGIKVLQILTNLIENACKFTVEGSVEVSLSLKEDEFIISVNDSGVGIPREQLADIWSEFHQGQTHGGRRGGGFGLGLAIVRQYTTMLGGRYGAESQEGHGARVWVSLPAGPSQASVVEAEAPDELGRAATQE
jgi:signal transduction histidine kinase